MRVLYHIALVVALSCKLKYGCICFGRPITRGVGTVVYLYPIWCIHDQNLDKIQKAAVRLLNSLERVESAFLVLFRRRSAERRMDSEWTKNFFECLIPIQKQNVLYWCLIAMQKIYTTNLRHLEEVREKEKEAARGGGCVFSLTHWRASKNGINLFCLVTNYFK